MDTENALLLFEKRHPCWTRAMFAVAGRDEDTAEELEREGLLRRDEDVWFLSPEGEKRFRQVAEESFLPLRPGHPETDARLEAKRSLLELLLDKRHLQRWGLKEYCRPFRFEVPDLKGEALFGFVDGRPVWRWDESAPFSKMAEDFPVVGMAARDLPAPDADRISRWTNAFMPERRTVTADLLYKSRYDFQEYARFPSLPGDPCGLKDTDRFFCFFAPPPLLENVNAMLTTLGEFQMYLTMLRRMLIPGYVDRDSLEQDGINWLLYVFERENDARACADLLAPMGNTLSGAAAPLEIRSLSLEALTECRETAETIHDLWPSVAHTILQLS